jgi:hypothetical protein
LATKHKDYFLEILYTYLLLIYTLLTKSKSERTKKSPSAGHKKLCSKDEDYSWCHLFCCL